MVIEKGGNISQKTSNGHHFLRLLIKANLEPRQKLELVKLSVGRGASIAERKQSSGSLFAAKPLFSH